jgi:hypothetical protein
MRLFCARGSISMKNRFAKVCAFLFLSGRMLLGSVCVKCQEIVVLNFATFWEEIFIPLVDYRIAPRAQADDQIFYTKYGNRALVTLESEICQRCGISFRAQNTD